jgi:hypothetical protein
MTYSKPEVAELGKAAVVIQGSKIHTSDTGGTSGNSAFELCD